MRKFLKHIANTGLGALAGLALAAAGAAPAYADGFLIRNVTIADPVAGEIPAQDIAIEGSRIIAVTPAGEGTASDGASVIDGTGKYVIPALWDAHVHLTFDPEIGAAALPLFVANGVTRVRDTGGHLAALDPILGAAEALGPAAPDIYFAGPLIDGVPRVYDGTPSQYPDISVGAATPDEARAHVDSLAAAGARLIKAYEMLTPETFEALVARATERGLPVTAHIPLSMSLTEVAATGIRGMEHLRNVGLACSAHADRLLIERRQMLLRGADKEGSTLRSSIHGAQRPVAFTSQDPARCEAAIATLAEARIFQTPTLALNTRHALRQYLQPEWRSAFAYLPGPVERRWQAVATLGEKTPVTPDRVAFADWSLAMTRQLHEAGVPIMAGTDTPIGLLTPGVSLHLELEMLVEAGLSPQQALTAATVRPAEFFGLEGEMGRIAEGMSADLVLLTANPLADIRNTRKIEAVITRGAHLDRASLDQLTSR